jgi:uncharacterized protein (TIGR00645 family)
MAEPAPPSRAERVEGVLERVLFHSRWLLAPIYFGLVVGLLALTVVFMRELASLFTLVFSPNVKAETVILWVLTLVDVSLAANLVLIVIFSGYENFVSKLLHLDHPDRPDWLGKIDFGGLKLKLIASIAAISAIQLLKVFVQDSNLSGERIMWLVVIHLTFVLSGVMLAVMDYLTAKSKQLGYEGD